MDFKNFKLKIKNWIEFLRSLPDKQKKIILWTIVVILAIIMGIFWIRGTMDKLSKMGNELGNIKLPEMNIDSSLLETTTPSNQEITK